METLVNTFSLNGCLAVKQGDLEKAKLILQQVATLNDKVFLQATKDMILMAIRRHHEAVLVSWMDVVIPRLKIIVAKPEMFDDCRDFLESFIFAVCDHRIGILRADAQIMTEIFHDSVEDVMKLQSFYAEITSLASRMAIRKWDDEAVWLLKLTMDNSLKTGDSKFIDSILFKVNMHAIMAAKNFGLGRMLDVYKEVQFAYMILVSMAGREDISEESAKDYLSVCLRNQRNLISNIARITMKDEMEVYDEWYHHLLYYFGKEDFLKYLVGIMAQLVVTYWHETQPKSSRKQIRFLEHIMTPNRIDEHYRKLLDQIV